MTEQLRRIEVLARALATKLRECEPHIESAAVLAHVHGARYTGPTYGVELEQLEAALLEAHCDGTSSLIDAVDPVDRDRSACPRATDSDLSAERSR